MTVHEILAKSGEMLMGRWGGPMSFRCVMQPLVACFLAVSAAIRDARAGRPAYFFWPVFYCGERRKELLRQLWKDVGKVFLVACVLDVIYEMIVYRWVYPGQAMIVGVVLAIVPYLLLRGPVGRLARLFL